MPNNNFGYDDATWEAAKKEMRDILVKLAKTGNGKPITYKDLANQVNAIHFHYRSAPLDVMLCEISSEEDASKRKMLSALVINEEDNLPGPGFFVLARQLHRNTSDTVECWTRELNEVLDARCNK